MKHASHLAEIALHPSNRSLTKFAKAQKKQRQRANIVKRKKVILEDLQDQIDRDGVAEIMQQESGDWFRGITHDYVDYSLKTARSLYPDRTLYVYRTDEMLLDFEDTLTGETFPSLDITVTINDRARELFVGMAKKLGTFQDQIDWVNRGYDGCAATYYANRFANIYLLETYKGNHPDIVIRRPMMYIYDGDDIQRSCVDTAAFDQGHSRKSIPRDLEGANDFEQKLLDEIIEVQIHK